MTLSTKNTIIIFDTETTGNLEQDRICQLAFKTFGEPLSTTFDELYKPEVPISVESQAVHHIRPKMVESKPSFVESEHFAKVQEVFEDPNTIVVAHNAKFDVAMLAKEEIFPTRVIDTLKIVRHLDPDMKIARHNLQYLRYLLELDNDIPEGEQVNAHDAKGDVLILEKLFERLFKKMRESSESDDETLEKMIAVSAEPSLISKFTFGKHIGLLVSQVAISDRGYLEWLLKSKLESEQDEEDWIYTLRHFLDVK